MDVRGIDGMTLEEIRREVEAGARFLVFPYCFSIIVASFQRGSVIHFVHAGDSAAGPRTKYALLSLVLGVWGVPFGWIFTLRCLWVNGVKGGYDVTGETLEALAPSPLRAAIGEAVERALQRTREDEILSEHAPVA